MSIKDYIINNLKGNSFKEIEDTIISSIDSKDDVVLPGLGVLFEIVWNNSDEENKKYIIDTLINNIK